MIEEVTVLRFRNIQILVILNSLCFVASVAVGGEYQGTVTGGHTFVYIEGNHGVHQPTYNLYDGVTFSLERFRYQWNNGMQLSANIINPHIGNRRLNVAFNKVGVAGASIKHNSYRRTYDFDRTAFTRREATSGSVWFRPVRQLKLFGGYSLTNKHGDLFQLGTSVSRAEAVAVDFADRYYHAGMELKHQRSYCRFECQVSDFSDGLNPTSDRGSKRLRLNAYSPLPKYDDIVLGGGFQHFDYAMKNRTDTLNANTVWGAVRYTHALGYQLRYSFMFDRARRVGDLAATDNIVQAVSVGRTWRKRGGIVATYGNRINDDVRVERSRNEYSISGWLAPVRELTLRGGFGLSGDDIKSGRTLTGDRDYARHWLLARYRLPAGFFRVRIDDRHRDNDEIGSSVDFTRVSGDLSYTVPEYGEFFASYALSDGNYSNASGVFEFREHVLIGDATTKEYRNAQISIGGSYYRARQDVDVEAFTVRITGKHRFLNNTMLVVAYTAHNFDNLSDLTASYHEYYTANVVEVNIMYEL